MSILTDPTTALAGPALRLHLLELYLRNTDMPDMALSLAQAAERWIAGAAEPSGDPTDDPGWDAIEMPVPDMPTHATVVAGCVVHGDRPLGPTDVEGLKALIETVRDRVNHPEEGHAVTAPADPQPSAEDGPVVRLKEIAAPVQPEPAPEPEPQPEPAPAASPGKVTWTPERKEELRKLCAEGLEAKEIEERLGLGKNGAHANAGRFGFTAMWREARERRRAQQQEVAPAAPEAEEEAAPEIEVVVTRKEEGVELPPPPVEAKLDASDLAGIALAADKPTCDVGPRAARDVPPGQSWAFNHPTLAEVENRPAPVPPPSERERLIEEHVKTKGVTTAPPDFGPDQPAVDVLRGAYHSVVRSNDPKSPWLINGKRCTTPILWKRANAELKSRRQKTIKRVD